MSLTLCMMVFVATHARASGAPAFEGVMGKVESLRDGAQLFEGRRYTMLTTPAELQGMSFIQAPIDRAQTLICTRGGELFAFTPADISYNGQGEYLEAKGFVRLPAAAFQPFGESARDRSAIYRKDVEAGERIRVNKWVVFAARSGLEFTQNNPADIPWTANNGERLYNGIVLPKVWPPVNMDPVSNAPMPVPYLQSPPTVISIDVGRQLFVDDFLVENTDLRRRFHRAEKYRGNPVFKAETEAELATPIFEGNEKATTFLGHGGVFYDPSDKLFKMFYMAGWRGGLALATSTDMINWTRPDLGLPAGGNLLLARGTRWEGPELKIGGSDNAVWLDLNATDPAERYKYMTCWMHADRRPPGFNHTLHVTDGLGHWSDAVPVKPAAEDYSSFFYNPFRDVWVFSMKTGSARGRSRKYFESKDFLKGGDQTEAVFWTGADNLDQPEPAGAYPGAGDKPQLYSLGGVAYESIIIGMHYIHRGPTNEVCVKLKIPKLLDLELGFSRDGFHWDRPDRTGFIRGEREEGSWERGYMHGVTGMFVVMGDRLVFPYMGTSGVAPDGTRGLYTGGAVGLATLRRDGFASMEAGAKPGTLTTRPLVFSGKNFFVNADTARGGLAVEIQDEAGNPIGPYTFANCTTFIGDSTLAEIRWRGVEDLSALDGKPVRISFKLVNGSLYSFWVSKDASGRSDGYLAAGGPGYPGVVDTVGKAALENRIGR